MFSGLHLPYKHKILLGFLPIVLLSAVLGFAVFVGVAVLAMISSFVVVWSIRTPLVSMNHVLLEIASGKIDRRVDVISQDEIGDIAQGLNGAIETMIDAQRLPESILRSMKDSLFVMNSDGLITEVNTAALETIGYTKEELLGKPISLILKKITT